MVTFFDITERKHFEDSFAHAKIGELRRAGRRHRPRFQNLLVTILATPRSPRASRTPIRGSTLLDEIEIGARAQPSSQADARLRRPRQIQLQPIELSSLVREMASWSGPDPQQVEVHYQFQEGLPVIDGTRRSCDKWP